MAKQQQGSSIGRYSVIQGRHSTLIHLHSLKTPPFEGFTEKKSTPNKESLWQLPSESLKEGKLYKAMTAADRLYFQMPKL